jgi:hypothetical protein
MQKDITYRFIFIHEIGLPACEPYHREQLFKKVIS